MSLWWMEPGWTSTTCSRCGVRIWPEGDPDWGVCHGCFMDNFRANEGTPPGPEYPCDICGKGAAVTGTNGYGVCSEACDHEARERPAKERDA